MDLDNIILNIEQKIHDIRDKQVILDSDLAKFYGVKTKRLNEQVKRNMERFPEKFMFRITKKEKEELVANCDHLNYLKFSSAKPYAFTEQGVAMLSSVLKSKKSVEVSIQIIEAFISMRNFISNNLSLLTEVNFLKKNQIKFELESNSKFDKIFNLLEQKPIKRKNGIFFKDQVFDAHIFISDLIKSAKKEIVLIDNYVNEETLLLFSKREITVKVIIYTKEITKMIKQDLDKYNSQYSLIELKQLTLSHDRFLIIDNKEIYHIGASLKDLGKKWFAFSKLDKENLNILEKLRNLNK
jgi:hypothetical protein